MSKVRIEFHSEGFAALLRHPGIEADIRQRAEAIAEAAGEGVDAVVVQGRDRVRAVVQTNTPEAKRAEAEDKTLTSAIGAGRG